VARDIFGPLLERPAFRADLLYFIRLAGNYAAAIFMTTRDRAASKHRKALAEWLEASPRLREGRNKKLREELIQRRPWFDACNKDFTLLLDEMPAAMRDRLGNALGRDHALPWGLAAFVRALDDLREYRNWLEHAEERRREGETRPVIGDERLLDILGLMLLPFLNNHLLGRMRHHGRRMGLRRARQRADMVKSVLERAASQRREASRQFNGLKRRTDNQSIAAELERKRGRAPSDREVHKIAAQRKKERNDLETRKAALLDLHRAYFSEQTWPRYNYENFLIRFSFIGRGRIAAIERLAAAADGSSLDFIHGIEPLFMLSMDIALILHSWLAEIEEEGVPVRSRKNLRKNGAAEAVVDIRNALAHNRWFWDVASPDAPEKPLAVREVLAALLDLPDRFAMPDPARWRNDLLTRIEATLRRRRKAYAYRPPAADDDPNRMPPAPAIQRWTEEKRRLHADRALWRIEKRPAVRRVAALWMRELQTARRGLETDGPEKI